MLEYVNKHLSDSRCQAVEFIATDCSSAFDTLDHSELLRFCQKKGIVDKDLAFLFEFIMNRHHTVLHNNEKSNPYVAYSGCPQGTNLGGLLFNFFTSDISEYVETKYFKYVDDVVLVRPIYVIEDVQQLQQDLVKLGMYFAKKGLKANATKFAHLRFSQKRYMSPILPNCYSFW